MPEASPLERAVSNIVKRCLIMLEGMVISKEDVSQSLLAFFSRVSGQRAHNIGVVLHTGSIVFDALAVFWAAIASLLSNESSRKRRFVRCKRAIWSSTRA